MRPALEWIYIIGYLVIFLAIILKTNLFDRNGIQRWQIAVLFIIKIFAGIMYGYLHGRYLPGGDTYVFFQQSKYFIRALEADPQLYLRLVFGPNNLDPIPPELYRFVFALSNWSDSGGYMMVRINAIFRLFSGGIDAHYNVHVIFMSFLSLIGVYYIYLFFYRFIEGDKSFLPIVMFAIPSIVFWYSGVHKEGVVIFSIGLILYNSQRLYFKGLITRNVIGLGIGILILGLVRFYLLALLMPVLISYYVVRYMKPIRPASVYFSIFFLAFICMGMLHWMVPEFSALGEAATKQTSFFNNTGDTTFPIPRIGTSYWHLLLNIPYTIFNPLIRPIPFDCNLVLCYLASVETYVLLIGIIILLTKFRISKLLKNNEALFCLFFSVFVLAVIGLIVNNAGAIVRYRSIVLPFIFIGLFLSSGFHKEESR